MSSNTPSNRALKESSPKRSSTHDLKNQLFEFQKKLNKRKSTQSSSNEPEIHLPPVNSPTGLTSSSTGFTSTNNGGNQQSDELRLTARKLAGRQRLSMPTLPNNPNATVPNNNNVDFLSELSDGLLVESRKMAYENKKLKARLKEIDVDTFQKQINNLTLINKKLSEKEEEYNDKIWDLETENGSLKDSLARTQSDFSKIFQDKTSNESIIDDLKSQVETLKIQKSEFESESYNKLTNLKESLNELKSSNLNLNDENDQLVQKVETLSTELTQAKKISAKQQPVSKAILSKSDPDESFGLDDSILLQPSDAEMKELQNSSKELEAETLKSNLDHAYGTITKLRHNLLKIKHDNDDLLNQLEYFKTGQRTSPSPSHDRVKLFMRKKLQLDNTSGLSPSKRQSKTLSYIDTTDSSYSGNVDWENFEGVDDQATAQSSPSKLKNIPSLIKSDDEEDFDDIPEINDSDTDSFSVKTTDTGRSLGSQNLLSSPLSSRRHLLSDELSDSKSISLKEIEEYAKQHKLKLISESEYDSLRVKPSNDSQEKAIAGAAALGLLALPNAGSEKRTTTILENLKQKCEEYNLVPVKQYEYNRLVKASNYDEIDEEVLIKKVDKFDLKLLPLTEYQEIENKFAQKDQEIEILNGHFNDVNYLSDKIKEFGYFALPSKEYDGLKSNLDDYEKKHFKLSESLIVKEASFSELQKSLNTRDLEISELNTTVASKEKVITELRESIDSYEHEVEHLKGEFTSKTNEITELKYYIVSKEKEMDELAVSVTTKSKEISELRETSESKSANIAELTETLQYKEKAIISLNDELLTKNQELKSVSNDLQTNEKELSEHKSKLANPSADFIHSSAALLGLTAIPIISHEKNSKDLEDKTKIIKDTQEMIESKVKAIVALRDDLESKSVEIEDLRAKIDNPSSEFVHHSAALLGLTAIPLTAHEKLLTELAEKSKAIKDSEGLLAVKEKIISDLQIDLQTKSDEIKVLKISLEKPDLEYVTTKADSHGLHVLPLEEYSSISKQLDDQSKELITHKSILKDKESELSLNIEELESLKKEILNKEAVLENQEKELKDKHSSLKALEAELSKKNLELDVLKKHIEEPDVEYVKSKSESLGFIPVQLQTHNYMKKELEEQKLLVADQSHKLQKAESELAGTHKQIEIYGADLGLKVEELKSSSDILASTQEELDSHKSNLLLKNSELESTKLKLDNPDLDFIREKATSHGMIVVNSNDHKQLQSDMDTLTKNASVTEQTLAFNRKEVEKLKSLIVSKDSQLAELKASHDSPSNDYIGTKATNAGFVLLPASDYQQFVSSIKALDIPLSTSLSSAASGVTSITGFATAGVLGIAASSIAALKKSSEKPSIDYLISNLSKNGYISIPKSQYDSLVVKNEAPPSPQSSKVRHVESIETMDTLKKKCASMGLVALSTSSYDSLIVSSKRSLTTVELIDRIEKSGMVALNREIYLALLDLFSSLGSPFGAVISKLKDPSSSNFKSSLTELRALIENQNKINISYESPSSEYVTEKAQDLGYKVITLQDYAQLNERKITVDESKELLESNNFQVVPKESYTKLNDISSKVETPNKEFVEKLASACGLSVLAVDAHDKLKADSAIAEKSQDELEAKSTELKTVSVKLTDLENDLETAKSELSKKEEELNKVKEGLENPSEDFIKTKASALGLIALLATDHESLKKDIDDQKQSLIARNKEFSNLETQYISNKDELSNLKEKLEDAEFVKSKAVGHGFVPLSSTDHADLNDRLQTVKAELKLKSDELNSKDTDLVSLREQLGDPEFVKSKASDHGFVVLQAAAHADLNNRLQGAVEELKLKSEELSSKDTDLVSLREQLEDAEFVKSKAVEHGFIPVPVADHDTLVGLKKSLNNPDFVKSRAIDHGFVPITVAQQSELNKKCDDAFAELKLKSDELASKNQELSDLKRQLEDPEFVKLKSSEHGFVPLLIADHSNMSQSLSDALENLRLKSDELDAKSLELDALKKQVETPDVEYIKTKSHSHGFIPIPIPVHKELENNLLGAQTLVETLKEQVTCQAAKLEKSKSELVHKDNIVKSLEEKLDNPDIDYIKAKSEILGLVSFPISEHKKLHDSVESKNTEIEALKTQAAEHHSKLKELKVELSNKASQIELLSQQLSNPDLEYIKTKSESHGLVSIPLDDHTELTKSVDDNASKVKKLELQISDKNDHLEQIKAQLFDQDRATDILNKQLENPDVHYLVSKAETHGMITISVDEFEKLKESIAMKDQELSSVKDQLDKEIGSESEFTDAAVFVPFSNPEKLLSNSNEVPSLADLDSLQAKLDAKSKELADIELRLDSRKLELQTFVSEQKGVENDDDGSKTKHLSDSGVILSTVSIDEFNDLKNKFAAKSAELESLKGQQSIAVANDSYMLSMKDAKLINDNIAIIDPTISLDNSVDNVSIVNPTVSPVSNTGEKKFNNPISSLLDHGSSSSTHASNDKDQQITELNRKIDRPSKEYLVEKLAALGYSTIPDQSRNRESVITNSTGTDSSLYMDAVSGSHITNSLYGDFHSTDSGFVDAFSEQGTESTRDVNDMFEPITEPEEIKLREEAKKYGFMLIPISQADDDNATSIDEITDVHLGTAEIQTIRPDSEIRPSSSIGPSSSIRPDSVTILDNGMHEEISGLDDKSLLKAKATSLGMALIPSAELLMLRESQNSNIMGASVVKKENTNKNSALDSSKDISPIITKENLQEYANDLGLKVLSKTEIERIKKRTITSQELATKAAELNLTLVPEIENRSKREFGVLTRDDLAIEARNQGMMVIPENQFVATTVSRKPDVPHVVVLPSTYYNKLLRSHEFYKISKATSPNNSRHPESFISPSEELTSMSSSFNTAPSSPSTEQFRSVSQTPVSTRVAPLQFNNSPRSIQKSNSQKFNHVLTPTHSPSLNSGNQFSLTELEKTPTSGIHSLRSVHTVITSKHEMIAAITQTIIGEYLYKYFRKLGPLSSVSESRHERFFWIHPYSLTLYWSSSNPVFNDPSSNKIRALAIVSVESVEDNNPLPPGLFHKSIVIYSKEKSIKITCPTRQRHNIWFNSLKYLIERNTDDLLGDDDGNEDQYNETFAMDQKVELERSQTFRHSQPRKYVLGGSHLSSRSVSSPVSNSTPAPPRLKSSRSLLGSVRNSRR